LDFRAGSTTIVVRVDNFKKCNRSSYLAIEDSSIPSMDTERYANSLQGMKAIDEAKVAGIIDDRGAR
jgi:hypothetical protein